MPFRDAEDYGGPVVVEDRSNVTEPVDDAASGPPTVDGGVDVTREEWDNELRHVERLAASIAAGYATTGMQPEAIAKNAVEAARAILAKTRLAQAK